MLTKVNTSIWLRNDVASNDAFHAIIPLLRDLAWCSSVYSFKKLGLNSMKYSV